MAELIESGSTVDKVPDPEAEPDYTADVWIDFFHEGSRYWGERSFKIELRPEASIWPIGKTTGHYRDRTGVTDHNLTPDGYLDDRQAKLPIDVNQIEEEAAESVDNEPSTPDDGVRIDATVDLSGGRSRTREEKIDNSVRLELKSRIGEECEAWFLKNAPFGLNLSDG